MLQFDEGAIAWKCNDLQKIYQTVSNATQKKQLKISDIKTFERSKKY